MLKKLYKRRTIVFFHLVSIKLFINLVKIVIKISLQESDIDYG